MVKVAVLDYNCGNIFSLMNALDVIQQRSLILRNFDLVSDPKLLSNYDFIILPGVGAYDFCYNSLSNIDGMIDKLNQLIIQDKSLFLGICVGMQILSNYGYEGNESKGLGWIEGEVVAFDQKIIGNLAIPHMGWNDISFCQNNKEYQGFDGQDFYFVHSYFFDCKNKEDIVATINYGKEIPVFVKKDNIYGIQFHAEKSGNIGINLLQNIIENKI